MPNLDGTGPWGTGPYGRGLGPCKAGGCARGYGRGRGPRLGVWPRALPPTEAEVRRSLEMEIKALELRLDYLKERLKAQEEKSP